MGRGDIILKLFYVRFLGGAARLPETLILADARKDLFRPTMVSKIIQNYAK
jgi:hypothetical protein